MSLKKLLTVPRRNRWDTVVLMGDTAPLKYTNDSSGCLRESLRRLWAVGAVEHHGALGALSES